MGTSRELGGVFRAVIYSKFPPPSFLPTNSPWPRPAWWGKLLPSFANSGINRSSKICNSQFQVFQQSGRSQKSLDAEKPVLTVLFPTWILRLWDLWSRVFHSRELAEEGKANFQLYFTHLLTQTLTMVVAAAFCILPKPGFYPSLGMGAVIFQLKQSRVQPKMSSFKPQWCL